MFPHWQQRLLLEEAAGTRLLLFSFSSGNDHCKHDVGELTESTFTLIHDVEPGFVLRVVAVEKKAGLVGGAEQRLWNDRPTEAVNHTPRLHCSTSNL